MIDVSRDSTYVNCYRISTDSDEYIVGVSKEELKDLIKQALELLLEDV